MPKRQIEHAPSARPWLRALTALVFASGALLVADLLVVTDREELESFVHAIEGGDDRVRVALDFSDADREPIEVVTREGTQRFDRDAEPELAEYARRVLAPLNDTGFSLVQDTVSIKGKRAQVAIRGRATKGEFNAHFAFERRGDGWLLTRVRVL